ncbi:erythrocyte membrane protein 1 (PfEMP1) [Plasmodium sp. gorilla clade G2]|uniref:erythrocyte membrane protein 1 (PfEMP1) n=1 Tax=Plasmodium sp. gorilla clade G2 TaxID=880535 RepID=UPI000D21D4D5|nr:erythrocyte membrane protein 1 (PfEMP1) [Plasmodium sp. gorilla clade G2]SOV17050.1 erythrocyte membrane protein 1 (PfEMP1) [Plasmodium sp. gorilla clade G2]
MGNTKSQEKSSLLRNFQYFIVQENGATRQRQYKLMYFDYLNFLKYEIDHEAWNWEIYKNNVTKKGGSGNLTEEESFCGWKEIQKKIFDKLIKTQKGQHQNKYNWNEHAEPLLNIARKKLKNTPDCKQITIKENDIKELQNPVFPAISGGSSSTTCKGINTAPNLHIPLRRRTLFVEKMYEYLNNINSEIASTTTLKEAIEGKRDAKSHIADVAGRLKRQMIDGLSTELSNLIKNKYKGTEHKAFCKEWQRTMDDYHTLFLKDDIVDENETKGIQCLIEQIEQKVGGSSKFRNAWSSHFKELVRDLQTSQLKDPTTQEACSISPEEKSQCIRFFEEWAEEFCKLKKDLGEMMLKNCKDDDKPNSTECKKICNIYKNFLEESQSYYKNYKDTCADPKFGYDSRTDLQESFSKAAMDSMTECCTDMGHCSDTQLFNTNADKSNLIYNCMCEKGKYTSERKTKTECSKYMAQNAVSGIQVPPQQPGTSGQSVVTATSASPKTVMDIAKQVMEGAKTQWKSLDTEGKLKGEPHKGKYSQGGTESELESDICKLKIEHSNDVRPKDTGYDRYKGPCTGKDNDGKRFVIGTPWKEGSTIDLENGELMSPRREHMCTSNLENLAGKGESPKFLSEKNAKVNDSFTGDVLLSAKEETQRILQMYKQNNDKDDQPGMCRAVRSSFADLGDIIRGKDIWEKNTDMGRLQGHLTKIFEKIKTEVGGSKYSTDTENTTPPYKTLREHWWSANREQVWEAMKCHLRDMFAATDTKSSTTGLWGESSAFCGYNTEVPVDDYIPQKLRWLTEWNESYCKQLERHYKDIWEQCTMCKNNEPCDKYNEKCDMCSGMCEAYSKHVKKWKEQWTKHETQYKTLSQGNGSEKDFIDKIKNGKNNNYENASDFVESMQGYKYCKNTPQREYKKEKSGKDYHVFEEKPKDFKDACDCKSKDLTTKTKPGAPAAPTPTTKKSDETTKCETAFNGSNSAAPNGVTLSEWDCTSYSDMCIKKGGTQTISDYSKKFDKIFDEWLTSFFEEQTKVSNKSTECTKLNSCPPNGCDTKCEQHSCKGKCPCYEKWVKSKITEWRHFKSAYHDLSSTNPTIWLTLKNKGNDADQYVRSQKSALLTTASSGISGNSNNVTIDTILNHEHTQVKQCLEKCPIKIGCEKKGFKNEWQCEPSGTAPSGSNKNMCEKKEDPEDNTGASGKQKSVPTSGGNDTEMFYNLFNEWLHDMEQMLGTSKTLVEKTCGNTRGGTTSSSGTPSSGGATNTSGEKDCKECKELCGCYEKLKGDIEKQWKEQQKYYDHHKDKGKDEEMKKWDIHTYLNAQCIINEAVKSEQPDSVQDDFDKVQGKCDKLKGSHDNYAEALIKKSGEDKTKLCEECEKDQPSKTPTDDCNSIQTIPESDCKEKKYDEVKDPSKNSYERDKNWKCTQTDEKTWENNVCVPPRTQPLCIANMYNSSSKAVQLQGNESDLKRELKKAIKTETKLLWDKNKSNPDKACRLTHRSLNDFKHMVIGDMLWGPDSIKKVQEKIGTIIPGGTNITTREKWWKDNEKDFWEAVKCGIKEAAAKPQNGGTSGADCPRFISDDDQFEWWAKEWSEDYYDKRNHLVKDMDTVCAKDKGGCKDSNSATSGQCKTKCDIYKSFLEKKRKEWKDNFEKYLKDKEKELEKTTSVNTKEYSPEIFYLLNPCTYQSCDNKYITALRSTKPYGDKQKLCACDSQSQTEDETNPCSDKFTEYGCSPKKYKDIWSTVSVKNESDRRRVFAPPRRNSMCIGWLFSPLDKSRGKMAAKNELRDKLIDAARGEAHYLWTYYNAKGGTTGQNSDYCKALTRSYYDYSDMIKGTDLWSAGYSPLLEKNIHEVFAMKESGSTTTPSEDDIVKDRRGWWESVRKDVWTAMQCKTTGCNPTSGDVPTTYESHDQFLRWFIEWGEHFCEQKQHYMTQLDNICIKRKCNSMCGGTTCEPCQKQCEKYNKWLMTKKNEWKGQKDKYKEEYKKPGAKNKNTYSGTNDSPHDYLKNKATGCNNEEFNKLFKRQDEKYRPYRVKCKKCIEKLTQDIVENIKNKKIPGSGKPEDIFSLCDKACEELKSKDWYKTYVEEDNDYTKIKGKPNCEGLKKEAEDNKIKWDNTEGGFKHLNNNSNTNEHVSENIYIPPRKQKICFKGLDGKYDQGDSGVKDEETLFKHLMKISAIEGFNLGEYYKQKNNNNNNNEKFKYDVEACNALKYSFLDLRDIILGYDNLEIEKNGTESHLNSTFKKIYEDDDKDAGKPGSIYRRNWWKSNQQCVWNAMLCGYKKGRGEDIQSCNTIPDDTTYPVGTDRPSGTNLQFLRWFAEWGEDYCGHYRRELEKLKQKCDNVQCNNASEEAKQKACKEQCDKYKNFIKPWKEQYDKQKNKFTTDKGQDLYTQDKEAKEAKDAREFLEKKLKISCKHSGSTSGQTSGNCNCMNQTSSQNSGDPASLDQLPSGYDQKCNCSNSGSKPVAPPQVDVCQQVEQTLNSKDNNGRIQQCKDKYEGGKDKYPKWDCEKSSLVSKKGECMPPRRQKLCTYNLKNLKDQTTTGLRKALIECAAIETYFAWGKYKKDNSVGQIGKKPDDELQNGTIPEEFKRIMFYTFGDFKDLILEKDIGNDVSEIKKKITAAFKSGGQNDDEATRKAWWKEIEKEVWDAMLCALSHDSTTKKVEESIRTKIENNNKYSDVKFGDTTKSSTTTSDGLAAFASRPQFLRWFTEWGEHFCRRYTKEYKDLDKACSNYNCGTNEPDKTNCEKQCQTYKKFIQEWKKHYTSQKGKFDREKSTYDSADDDAKSSKNAQEYLKKKLEKFCSTSGTSQKCDYKCMDETSNQNGKDIPKSLKETPDIVEGKCPCPVKPAPVKPAPQVVPQGGGGGGAGRSQQATKILVPDGQDGGTQHGAKPMNPDGGNAQVDITFGTTTSTVTPAPSSAPGSQTTVDTNSQSGQGSTSGQDPGSNTAGTGQTSTSQTTQPGAPSIPALDPNELWNKIKENVLAPVLTAGGLGYAGTKAAIDLAKKVGPRIAEKAADVAEKAVQTGIKAAGGVDNVANVAKGAAKAGIELVDFGIKTAETVGPILETTLTTAISSITNSGTQPQQPQPPPPSGPNSGPSGSSTHQNPGSPRPGSTTGGQHSQGGHGGQGQVSPGVPTGRGPKPSSTPRGTQPTDLTTTVSLSAIPWAIGVAFVGIAYLWLKKKPKSSPMDLLRVIDIPKNDYGIPDKTSTNRYIPYGRYKGKTYIYVEGDESDDYSYIRDISSSDITSSESEYEEIDLYKPRSPKYKTLIEVVLKPSNKTPYDDTYKDNIVDNSYIPSGKYGDKHSDIPSDAPSDNTPTYKLTEEEWNKLKQDFILNMLQNDNMDLPNENIIDDNIPKDIQPDIIQNNMDEKPFITQIQDRKLHSDDSDVLSYNIDWNVPENIITNNLDIPKNVTSNDQYSGIDLINDSLSGKPIDIYDELLKRKENELYGTNHPKNTTTNSGVMEANCDPISSQLNLFHKWLDRNRYMCEKWSNKEEMLNKLNKEWEKENNINYHIIYNTSNDIINNINNKSKLSNANVSMEINMDKFNVTNTDVLNANIS